MFSGHVCRHCWTTFAFTGFVGFIRAVGRFRFALLLLDFLSGFFVFAMSQSDVEWLTLSC
jgi:hypothetical protein